MTSSENSLTTSGWPTLTEASLTILSSESCLARHSRRQRPRSKRRTKATPRRSRRHGPGAQIDGRMAAKERPGGRDGRDARLYDRLGPAWRARLVGAAVGASMAPRAKPLDVVAKIKVAATLVVTHRMEPATADVGVQRLRLDAQQLGGVLRRNEAAACPTHAEPSSSPEALSSPSWPVSDSWRLVPVRHVDTKINVDCGGANPSIDSRLRRERASAQHRRRTHAIIDADSHVIESEATWQYLDPKFTSRRPIPVTVPAGDDVPRLEHVLGHRPPPGAPALARPRSRAT